MLEPKILLLDEPFASLDQHLRERLREEVRDIQQRLKITTLFVTHGQDEALALADRIVVMRDGRTEQVDPPDVVYREPATPFVAGFIGTMNLVDGVVGNGTFTHAGFTLPLPVGDGPATLAVRPEALDIVAGAGAGMAKIHRVTDYGTHAIVDIELPDGVRLKAMVPEARELVAGAGGRPQAARLRRLSRQRRDPPERVGHGRSGLDHPQRAQTYFKWHRGAPAAQRSGVHRQAHPRGHGARGVSVEVDLVVHARQAALPCCTT